MALGKVQNFFLMQVPLGKKKSFSRVSCVWVIHGSRRYVAVLPHTCATPVIGVRTVTSQTTAVKEKEVRRL